MRIAMTSIGHSMDLPSIPLISRPSPSSCDASGLGLMRTPQEGRFSGYQRPNDLFYEHYGASDYASSSTSTSTYGSDWHRQQSSPSPLSHCSSCSANDPSTRRGPPYVQYEGILDTPLLYDGNVGIGRRLSPLPPAVKSTLTRDLSPADPDTDYMDHLPPITAEGPLSPLSFYQDWQGNQLPLDPLHHEIYISSMQLPPPKLVQKERERGASMLSDDDNDTSPERRPYPPLLDIGHEWVTSPESVDTDLDDESVLSSSTSSLSPPYPDSDLRHFPDSEEYIDDVDDDDFYFPHALFFSESPISEAAAATPSPVSDLYHPLEQYPSHYEHLYNPIVNTSPPPPPHDDPSLPPLPAPQQTGDVQPPSPLGPSFSLIDPLSNELFSALSEWEGGRASTPPSSTIYRPSPCSFSSLCEFDDDALIPCSPSRRRSTDLPTLDDDPFGLQGCSTSTNPSSPLSGDAATWEPPQRTQWLSLPGAETDDDLIPKELASKNYVPDPTITVPSSQVRGSLLIWGPASQRLGLGELFPAAPTPRSPSPENLDLDPAMLAELAPEGQGEEAQKLYEMRMKSARGGCEGGERERCRELSALLRLKLRLDEKRPEVECTPPLRSVSLPCPSTSSSSSSSSLRSPPRRSSSSSKSKITSMAQLVANMVFHRQQQDSSLSPKRNAAPRSSSRMSSSSPAIVAAAAPLGSSSSSRAHPTPRSPLRQVTLPPSTDDEDEEEEDQCLSPLTPFGLCESPLSYSQCLAELEPPIRTSGREHDQD